MSKICPGDRECEEHLASRTYMYMYHVVHLSYMYTSLLGMTQYKPFMVCETGSMGTYTGTNPLMVLIFSLTLTHTSSLRLISSRKRFTAHLSGITHFWNYRLMDHLPLHGNIMFSCFMLLNYRKAYMYVRFHVFSPYNAHFSPQNDVMVNGPLLQIPLWPRALTRLHVSL